MFSSCGPAWSSLLALSRHLPIWQFDGREMTVMERLCYLRQLLGEGRVAGRRCSHIWSPTLSHLTSEIDFLKGHARGASSIGEAKKCLSL